ncbi:hypothetical protein P9Y62_02810 [Bacillus thuringiensis]|uniref:Phage protein n=1 Tax=Bacillus thuringiensis HD-771 TaxID=1218175 RepID=A0A9W3NXX8_BACTU|nr:hypothetical protein [Bacillus thuringiensis]EEM37793.1 hypothetical protein bthur0004_63850 [Bacillus thuringiensis serovar sotto str. T04001]AFQ16475.1 phage protein [Bacillus thuringiensis HD-771]AFQ17986.1 phage protein [Bacillus thuringiensis HD-771]AND06274.1 hypothetical protein Bt4C1_03395 [Bacillus thuringiensis serovar alesti]AND06636.1 hypothetical protein Bt4C1_05405 [Bacillus thuringiensis serovar alesti]
MQLTKLEKAIAISTLLHSVGVDDIEEYVDVEKLPILIEVIEGFHNNLTPAAKKEADISLMNKLIDDLLRSKRLQKIVQFRCKVCGYTEQYSERIAKSKDRLRCKWCADGGVMCNEGIQNQTAEA